MVQLTGLRPLRCVLLFLVLSFKSVDEVFRQRLRLLVDAILLTALVTMAFVCCVLAYAMV
jgi:hypothetical protein